MISRGTLGGRYHGARSWDQKGIALGPILFIIAILAVIAAVITSTTGVFSTSSGNERARLHANAVIEQGTALKLAVERMSALGVSVGTTATTCASFDPNSPELYLEWNGTGACANFPQYALFDPRGGASRRPTAPAEALPADTETRAKAARAWQFIKDSTIEGSGADAGDFVASIEVTQPVCAEVNDILYSTGRNGVKDAPPTVTTADITIATGPGTGFIDLKSASVTPAIAGVLQAAGFTIQAPSAVMGTGSPGINLTSAAITSRVEGCISNGAATPRYIYYVVLAAR